MKVELVNWMGSDLSVVDAARVSFDKTSNYTWEDGQQVLKEEDKKLIKYLATHNHWTPFGHASASFRITIPVYVARQLAKHQVGGVVNEISRRYIKTTPVLDVPSDWRKSAKNVKQGSLNELVRMDSAMRLQIDKTMDAALQLYEDLLMVGVCPEQARAVLPLCCETTWVWSGSLAFFARVCKLRLDPHAQKETRDVAELIAEKMRMLFPVSWEALIGY